MRRPTTRRCDSESMFRNLQRFRQQVDRWRPESSVVLLGEVDKLSISSPGMQRLSAGTCWHGGCLSLLTDLSSEVGWSVVARPGILYPAKHEFLIMLRKQCSGSELHQTACGKDGTKEWSEENAWDRGIYCLVKYIFLTHFSHKYLMIEIHLFFWSFDKT